MADIVTGTVSGQVDMDTTNKEISDARRESAEHLAANAFQNATQTGTVIDAIKTAGWHNSDRTGTEADRIVAQNTAHFISAQDRGFQSSMTIARDTADLRAQVIQAIDTTKLATELNALKGIIEGQKNTTYLSDKISLDGEKTRALINDLKYHDLNRMLVERNDEVSELRNEHRHYRHAFENSQQANLVSQINALNSQFQETRQGMVNFGTMAGVGQSSTSNNVR